MNMISSLLGSRSLRIIALSTLMALTAGHTFAQRSDGRVRSLVRAEDAFNRISSRSGLNNAMQDFAADKAIIFNPNATEYSKGGGLLSGANITYTPVVAEISLSKDFAYTTGSYVTKTDSGSLYGDYLTVWKVADDNWKIAAQMKTERAFSTDERRFESITSTGKYESRLQSEKSIQAANDILYTTEKTLNSTIKTYGAAAFAGYTTDGTRFMFMNNKPIVGKKGIVAFLNPKIKEMKLTTQFAQRATSADLAYTYGQAVVDYKIDLRETLNYLFVWKLDDKHNWNIIQMIMIPAER